MNELISPQFYETVAYHFIQLFCMAVARKVLNLAVFSDVAPCSLVEVYLIALTMEAASTFKTSVNLDQTTRRNIPEDSHLHTGSRENLKSQVMCYLRGEYGLHGCLAGCSAV
jgi:hypothetical protein